MFLIEYSLLLLISVVRVLHVGKAADKTPTVYLINNIALVSVLSCRDLGITIGLYNTRFVT